MTGTLPVPDLGLPADPTLGDPVLDQPVWASLLGVHGRLAERHRRAARYHPDVAGFVALSDPDDPAAWADLAALVGPGVTVALSGVTAPPPPGWRIGEDLPGVQMVDVSVDKRPDPEAIRLTREDVPEILDLVDRTRPGPFRPGTIELGTYLGIRRGGRLVAMAGERLHPPGWTEISAVCTDPGYRGQGLATRLVSAVGAGIAARGERALLHAWAGNVSAIRLYESLGFRLRRTTRFAQYTTPEDAS
ncbi:GNAT family N-acetyltransferase [Nakamurella flava]|uniref:GNAT family N-acetyltransferase n=1 Tax=Nakamurella flava TaxID=2576308 RepID=A0A4U6QKN6_9ACTN|nr:GNAT family N-acetyltransferase [Nakamurella flava]TKV60849.1 GNAT family N-acetyltransferase [Nakamurella flava]